MDKPDSQTPEVPSTGTSPTKTALPSWLWFPIRSPLWTALLATVVIVGLHAAVDEVLARTGHYEISAAVSNLILGVVAFVLLFRLLRFGRERRERMLERVARIHEMNHHIRNALQVIAFNARPTTENGPELAEIREALDRIHWTIREILPQLEPEFEAFDGSARDKKTPPEAPTQR